MKRRIGFQAGVAQPIGHFPIREPQPAMGVLLSQELQIVRSEVDHE
jgi:hypothetical protein